MNSTQSDYTKNPFSLMPMYSEQDILVFTNRNHEINIAFNNIKLGKNILIIGEWGIGKTSFIYYLKQKIKLELKNSIIFDISIPLSRDQKEPIKTILASIAFELNRWKFGDSKIDINSIKNNYEFREAISLASIKELLLIIENYIIDIKKDYKKIIFIFDEIEKISFDITELAGIRDSLWRLNIVFIFSGHSNQLKKYSTSPMEPFFSIINLKHLNEIDTKELIEKRVKFYLNNNLENVIDIDIIPIIHKYSRGNPRQILHIMSSCYNYALYRGVNKITEKELWKFIDDKISINENPLNTEILKILYNNINGLSVSEIHNKLNEKNIQLSRSRVSQLLIELNKTGILLSNKKGRKNIYKPSIVKSGVK